jgi:transcriptional regulator NrdR family protein
MSMKCPKCKRGKLGVIDSRPTSNGIRRRRACSRCRYRLWTVEVAEGAAESAATAQAIRVRGVLETALRGLIEEV